MRIKLLLSSALMCVTMLLPAKVTLFPVFTDNMVLQQRTEVRLWGEARPEREVKVVTSWNGATYTTISGEDGRWSLYVDTPSAGGPYSMTFSDGKEKTVLENILIGEVWICSGQSNMEMKMSDKVIGWEQDLATSSEYTDVRILHVKNSTSPVPKEDIELANGGWKMCDAENLKNFSATAFYFGRYLNDNIGVPVGLIQTCWGGTVAEAWTSPDALALMGDFDRQLKKLPSIPMSLEDRQKLFEEEVVGWTEEIKGYDPGFKDGDALWAMSEYDDSQWQNCVFPSFLQFQGFPSTIGFFWLRKTVDIPTEWDGKDLELSLATIDDNDFSYFEGVQVGHTEGCIHHRKYTVPASAVKAGKATIAIRVHDTGGMGGVAGDPSTMYLKGPDGKEISLAGEWKFRMAMKDADVPYFPVNTSNDPNYPTFLYNAMIHPLIDFPIAGAIWYQGESNASRAAQYKDLLPLMINDWRQKWGYDFPFYIAQIANYMAPQTGPEESQWAELREAQLQTLNLENTGMAVLIDIGEAMDIHPKNKIDVGKRLALNALAKTYGCSVPYSGPIYDGYTMEGDGIRVRFTHADGGLMAKGSECLEGFYIAGPDHVFHKAEAVIEGDTIVVRNSDVPFPVAVRYGWADNPVCNLYNGAGLPASPFRTDSWTR